MKTLLLALAAAFLISSPVWAQLEILEPPLVTDVTPRSFSVVWITSDPAQPSLKIFNSNGSEVTNMFQQTAFPTMDGSQVLIDYAKNVGMMKVRVEGLLPDTLYSFQIQSDTDAETLVSPADATIEVRTEKSSEIADISTLDPTASDLVRFQVFKPDRLFAARGSLLVAWVEQSSHPISAYVGDGSVGDGAEPGLVILDLNLLYDSATNRSLTLDSEVVVKLKELRGNGGQGSTLVHFRKLAAGTGQVSVVFLTKGHPTDINLDGEINLYDATYLAGSWGFSLGDNAFNPDFDFNEDDTVDEADSQVFVLDYGKSEPF